VREASEEGGGMHPGRLSPVRGASATACGPILRHCGAGAWLGMGYGI
jgi:hypothetical protein